uniref:Adropin-like n=1 Tax=Scleropages formosus TaxID=113540 RepID=A0A8C9V247_SCLFO
MESGENAGLSPAAIVAIVCNSVVGVLIFILFVILYKACQVPSRQEKTTPVAKEPEQQATEHKYLLTKL